MGALTANVLFSCDLEQSAADLEKVYLYHFDSSSNFNSRCFHFDLWSFFLVYEKNESFHSLLIKDLVLQILIHFNFIFQWLYRTIFLISWYKSLQHQN